MIIVLFLYYLVQCLNYFMSVNCVIQTQSQQYRSFFTGQQQQQQQQHFFRQKPQDTTNNNDQKWFYGSNKQPLAYGWQWINQNLQSSNFYQNSYSPNQMNPFSTWSCGRSPVINRFSRIMGGQDAVPHSYPWMVSLSKRSLNNLHLCGGTLITQQHVLTAAHCIEDFDGVQDMNVVFGSHYATDKRNIASAIAMTVHPQYEPETFANDIAIITLQTPIPENDPRIGTICLPPDDLPGRSYPPIQSSAVAIGWGSTYFGGDTSNTLKQVVLPVLETLKWPCNIYVTYAQGQICAGVLSGGADTCQADSGFQSKIFSLVFSFLCIGLGGPLMIENSENRWEIIGITSFGKSW